VKRGGGGVGCTLSDKSGELPPTDGKRRRRKDKQRNAERTSVQRTTNKNKKATFEL
jgi:hypothetical protein